MQSERFFRDYFYGIEYLSEEEVRDLDIDNEIGDTNEYNDDIVEFYDDNKLNYIQELFSYESHPPDAEHGNKETEPEESSKFDLNSAYEHKEEINKAEESFPIGEIWNALKTDNKRTLPKDINITYSYQILSLQ